MYVYAYIYCDYGDDVMQDYKLKYESQCLQYNGLKRTKTRLNKSKRVWVSI